MQVSHSSLSGLHSWKTPAVPSSTFSASHFRAFLPPKNKVNVGDTWWVIPSELNIFTGYLPNNRYHPPTPKGKEVQYTKKKLCLCVTSGSWALFWCRFSFTPCWVCFTLGLLSSHALLLRAQSPAFVPAMTSTLTLSLGKQLFKLFSQHLPHYRNTVNLVYDFVATRPCETDRKLYICIISVCFISLGFMQNFS